MQFRSEQTIPSRMSAQIRSKSTQQTQAGAPLQHFLLLWLTCLFRLGFFFFLCCCIQTQSHTFIVRKPAHLRKTHLPGYRLRFISPQREFPWADPCSRAVIDEDPQSHGSHGKGQFVYSALSPGSLWQFDLYHADVRHRLLVRRLALLAQAAPLLSIQCILMKRRGGKKKNPGSRSDSWSDPEMGAKSRRVKLEEKSDILFGERDASCTLRLFPTSFPPPPPPSSFHFSIIRFSKYSLPSLDSCWRLRAMSKTPFFKG